ncbi:hypothetical protein [Rhodococcus sp. ARP2]|uniref:hypothetical protein n=1 Tax=Rhodococcus sp. ARP2 TaxID=1661385 RepID=UPI00069EF425|nr:hypothetical protein [Rhodococcus sp. ARP2]
MFTDTIAIQRAPVTRSRQGNEVFDWDNATATPVSFLVSVQPSGMIEGAGGRSVTTVSNWRLITPAGTDLDLLATDRVLWAGRSLEVVGEIARWPHPMKPGEVHHVETELQKVAN